MNFYGYALQNPTGYLDPSGLLVTITITRDTYTANSITGTLTATSDVIADTVTAYTLENYPNLQNWGGEKGAIRPGTYDAFLRTDYTPNRVQLRDVLGYDGVQIHNGNFPLQLEGCFAIGQPRTNDAVWNSVATLNSLIGLIREDAVWGDGRIRVIVRGWPWDPGP